MKKYHIIRKIEMDHDDIVLFCGRSRDVVKNASKWFFYEQEKIDPALDASWCEQCKKGYEQWKQNNPDG